MLEGPELRWGVEQRLAFVETRLFWEGSLNRGDLIAAFDISVPQASKDLALYQQRAPGNLRYDAARKRYVAAADFVPRFITPDANAYLVNLLDRFPGTSLPAEHLPIPARPIDADILRQIVAAIRERQSVEIVHQSMVADRAGPATRRISPHAFAHDGARWHVRAWCEERNAFLDFILSRCLSAGDPSPAGRPGTEDDNWNGLFAVVLAPNPALSPNQQRVIADDYGMASGEVVLQVRRALLPYFHRRLRLDLMSADPRGTGVVVRNRAAYDDALRQATPTPD